MAFALRGATNSVAAAGPLVGGLLTQYLDRRWTLFVHLPVCLAAVAMTLATAFVVSALAGRFGPWLPRATIGGGLALIALGFATQAGLDAESSGGSLVAGLVVAVLGVGLVTPSLSAAALAAVPPERGGMVGGAVSTFRRLGFTRGIAVFGVIFQSRIEPVLRADGGVRTRTVRPWPLSGGQAGSVVAGLPEADRDALAHLVREAFASGTNAVLVVAAARGAVASPVAVATVRIPAGGTEQRLPSPLGPGADAALETGESG
ncbi:hypothetical protein [Streptomyces sp. NPDC004285]